MKQASMHAARISQLSYVTNMTLIDTLDRGQALKDAESSSEEWRKGGQTETLSFAEHGRQRRDSNRAPCASRYWFPIESVV